MKINMLNGKLEKINLKFEGEVGQGFCGHNWTCMLEPELGKYFGG